MPLASTRARAWLALVVSFVCVPAFAYQTKEKTKAGETKVIDKTKPVRQALEAWYAANKEAFSRKDVVAIMRLRTDDFHTILPNGTVNSREAMERRTTDFIGRIERWISMDITLGTIEVNGDLASTYVKQRTKRLQRLADGEIHTVEAGAIQRETWRKTRDGWKLYKVDDIKDDGLLVDGKPYPR